MKTSIKIFWIVFILSAGCIGSLQANTSQTSTIYVVEKSKSISNSLTVHVIRHNKNSNTQLILRGASMGITEQVQNILCDNRPIKENKPGVWQVPTGCQKLQWNILLAQHGTELASSQQSINFGNSILISEASSLPRLKDASS